VTINCVRILLLKNIRLEKDSVELTFSFARLLTHFSRDPTANNRRDYSQTPQELVQSYKIQIFCGVPTT